MFNAGSSCLRALRARAAGFLGSCPANAPAPDADSDLTTNRCILETKSGSERESLADLVDELRQQVHFLRHTIRDVQLSAQQTQRNTTEVESAPDSKHVEVSVSDNNSNDTAIWKAVWKLLGWWGIIISLVSWSLGFCLATGKQESLTAALREMIPVATVLPGVAVVIFVWIAGQPHLFQTDRLVSSTIGHLTVILMYSSIAIVGIGFTIAFGLLSSDTHELVLRLIGGFASFLMGLVLVGSIRILFSIIRPAIESAVSRLHSPETNHVTESDNNPAD